MTLTASDTDTETETDARRAARTAEPPEGLAAAVFDLDGVLTRTARVHAAAWKELIDGYLAERSERTGTRHEPFGPDDYRRHVDGKPRLDGLADFLASRGIELPRGEADDPPERETIAGLAGRKNALFRQALERHGIELVEPVVELARQLRSRGVRCAVASSSRNCREIVERAGIADLFDARVDGVTLARRELPGKPAPDLFLEAVRELGIPPERAAVFEDSLAGVEAGRRGGFGVVVAVAPGAEAARELSAYHEAGADLVAHDLGLLSPELLDAWITERDHRLPSALGAFDRFLADLGDARPALFLDYDGTLTPIVDRPDQAVLSDETRRVVARLAEQLPTCIVSGRGRADVERLVGIDGLWVAGSHGFDIAGPGGEISLQAAREIEPVIERLTERLETELAQIDGALVEPKRFTVAVHYRMVAPERVAEVERIVDRALEGHPELQKADGKKVFEIRPAMDWDKGRAVDYLLETLELDRPGVVPVYLGDDTTDEDAFRAFERRAGRTAEAAEGRAHPGLGVVVMERPRPSVAHYQLQDPLEVRLFLARLAAAAADGSLGARGAGAGSGR